MRWQAVSNSRWRHLARRLAPALFFFLLPMALFWPVTLGGKSLVPFDNLYQFAPWHAYAEQMGVDFPHNELLSDLLLENYAWKRYFRHSFETRQLPLWNPHIFSGMPFLADGQHSMLYPLSVLFLIMPVWAAYGWFTVITLAIAGLNMYIFLRVLGLRRSAALLGGLIFQGSAFLTISVVFQMIIAAATWLPLLLAMIHKLFEKARQGITDPTAYIPWVFIGSIALGLSALAGHPEMFYYNVLVGALYGVWHLVALWHDRRTAQPWRFVALVAAWGIALAGIGALLGAAQLVPLYELVRANFREGSATLAEVRSWAYPPRQLIAFLIPDFWGNPARHQVFDIVARTWRPIITQNVMGQTLNYVAWTQGLPSWKNYVEGAAYLGVLPLLLAGVGAWWGRRQRTPLFFTMLIVVSMLFIFGTPFYAVLYYGLPGWKQLHTPFRWVYPYTFAVSVLAAYGWHALRGAEINRLRSFVQRLGWLVLGAALAGLIVLAIMFALPTPFLRLAERVMQASELTRVAFGNDPALLVSYQWRNFAWFGIFLAGSGLALLAATRRAQRATWLALAVVFADLFIAAWGFNPATSPDLIHITPPEIAWLTERFTPTEPWRLTTLDGKGPPVFIANTPWFYGLHDVRGYDSIIIKHYVEFMEQVEGQGQLLYNRISPLFWEGSLDSALLDLLNVRYVLTLQTVERPGWRLVHEGAVRIYENEDVLPRAFVLPASQASVRPHDDIIANLKSLDPRREVWLEQPDAPDARLATGAATPRREAVPATILRYTENEVEVLVETDVPAVLVLGDTWFPGWRAFIRPSDEETEREVPIWRANGTFRAVEVPTGAWIVRWKYSPNSVKVGFFGSFLGTVLLVLAAAYWLWGRIYQEQPDEHAVRRVAKNSLAPMALQLLNKVVDTVFAAFTARILGPAGLGAYAFAIAIIWYFIIFSNFGLGTLLTREVAKDREAADRYLASTIWARLWLFALAAPVLFGIIWVWETQFGLDRTTSWAIVLLAIGLIPSNLADALTAVFRAFEKFEIPALISTITTILKVSIGAGALLAGYGVIGLAATSIITNVITLGLLAILLIRHRLVSRPRFTFDWSFQRNMLGTAFPLMLNDFLSTAFFRMDVAILQPMKGDTVVGWYNVGYKFIDGLNIIPSSFTLAVFPVMARYAEGARDALLRTTVLSLRWLVMLALPICVFTVRYADGIILAFGGPEYLPHSATALRLLIWFLPFSFINSVVHYVLIAVNQQRYLTRAFIIGVGFNFVANIALIPRFSYQAAAINTVLSEIALLLPFYFLLRQHVGTIPWWHIFRAPLIASAVMALPLWVGGFPFYLAIPLAGMAYVAGLFLAKAFTPDDWGVLMRLLPARLTPYVERLQALS